MSKLQTVGARLSLALLLVVAGALAFVYLIVVPSLERRLVDSRKAQVARVASRISDQWPVHPELRANPQDLADAFASATNTRVTIFTIELNRPLSLLNIADGGAGGAVAIGDDPVAREVAQTLRPKQSVVSHAGTKYAEAGEVLDGSHVVLVSSSLRDALGSVKLVERRLLVAAALALAAALLLGYGGAAYFARRIRRLERAADRIAGGRFDQPIEDESRDELGELARAFERMRQRLARLEHARREFIANASHELRTPLFSLGGHLELLADEELDDPTRQEFLARMREQVERLTKLAGELLDLSRIDAGRLRVDREPVDLARVAELLIEEFEALAQASEHELEPALDGSATGLGDEQRVLQVGRALVENALRHTPAGTRVRVRTERDGEHVVLAVEDDGPGIAAEHAGHVFERFYRGDGGVASGSGLGLAIARELAEVMHGELALASEPGRTVFTFSLPAASGTSSPSIE
ncbi:MAG TPA: ATP-binding protein [Gaiellaceae bacterium]|nr:ATP-binding protein [Gaiellaceae bacterium]